MCSPVHEYPLVKAIIKTAEEHAQANGASKVRRITLVVGDQSGYVPDSIQMYFDLIAGDTLCAGARLDVRRVKPKLRCPNCGQLFERRPFRFDCPACGVDGEPTDVGRELLIESIEIERTDEARPQHNDTPRQTGQVKP